MKIEERKKAPRGWGGGAVRKHEIGPGETRQKQTGRNNAAGDREGAGNAWAPPVT